MLADRNARIRNLSPISWLPPHCQEKILALAEDLILYQGSVVFSQGHDDNHVHYLLDGSIDLLRDGITVATVCAADRAARRPLDPPGSKTFTARAVSDVVVVRFARAEHDRQIGLADLGPAPRQLAISEIATEKPSHWMLRMLQSELFAGLPYQNIQQALARMTERPVQANEVVVRQGDPGDYYYLIDKGCCEVIRNLGSPESETHLADLTPGAAFGEAALVADIPRTASVVMLSAGLLMRLAKSDFNELIRDPLLHGVSLAEAKALVANDAIWLDLRRPEEFARRSLRRSVNIPLNMLRNHVIKLAKDYLYLVCGDDANQGAIGAFLLAERGFKARYLTQSVADIVEQDATMQRTVNHSVPKGSGNVITMPGPVAAPARHRDQDSSEVRHVEQKSDARPLEDTILKIDRLYASRNADAKADDRTPVADYADTATGRSLADLIHEMDERHAHLADTQQLDAVPVIKDPAVVELPVAEAPPAQPSPPESVIDLGARQQINLEPEHRVDELSALLRDFDSRVRGYLEQAVKDGNHAQKQEHDQTITRIREAAALQVRKKEVAIRAGYLAKYKEKELVLRGHYKKVIALANTISKQKAALQTARKQFEEKLRAANELYRQVEDMRGLLRGHLGSMDEISRRDAGSGTGR